MKLSALVVAAVLVVPGAARPQDWEQHRYTNPGDAAWCSNSKNQKFFVLRWNRLIAQNALSAYHDPRFSDLAAESFLRGGRDRIVVALNHVGAGSYVCASNAPGACRPHPEVHHCHATMLQRSGEAVPGTLSVNMQTAQVDFYSDAQERASGLGDIH